MDQIHKWFDRIGHWALLVGYFVAGVRHFTAIIAGTSKLEYPSFAIYAYTGAVLWVATFLTLGYYVGENWKQIAELLHRYVGLASIVVIAAVVVYLVLRRRKQSA